MAQKLQFYRNELVASSLDTAINAIKNLNLNAGEPVICEYTVEEGVNKILFAVKGIDGSEKIQFFDGIEYNEQGEIVIPNYVQDVINNINAEIERATGAETALGNRIDNLDVTDSAVSGQFVTSVSQTNGKITVSRGTIAATNVTASPISEANDTVKVEGSNVSAQIASLGKTVKTVQDNAAKYEVVKLTDTEKANLTDSANIKEAYKVVSYVGDYSTATKTQVGDTIKIYKDSSLKSVTASGDENTVITFIYTLANGSEETVTVDLGKAIFESEMGDGIKVVNSKIAIKLDSASETFLTVGADGIKLSGVQNAINSAVNTKVASLDSTVGSTTIESGKHVAVKVDEVDGKLTAITVTESDIASKTTLDGEIAARKAVDGQSGQTYSAKSDATYIKTATSLHDADVKLDTAVSSLANSLSTIVIDGGTY